MTVAVVVLGAVSVTQLAIIGWLMWMRRDDGRDIIALADRMARRLQAPQLAAVEAANEEHSPLYAPSALIPDDDDAFWESREALAERAMKEEVGGGNG